MDFPTLGDQFKAGDLGFLYGVLSQAQASGSVTNVATLNFPSAPKAKEPSSGGLDPHQSIKIRSIQSSISLPTLASQARGACRRLRSARDAARP